MERERRGRNERERGKEEEHSNTQRLWEKQRVRKRGTEERQAEEGSQNQVKSHDWDRLQAGLNILQHVVIYTTNVVFIL